MKDIRNSYNLYFLNGSMKIKLCFYACYGLDDYAIFERSNDSNITYIIGHNNNFDFDRFVVGWCWGHYDFESYQDAKNWINERIKESLDSED